MRTWNTYHITSLGVTTTCPRTPTDWTTKVWNPSTRTLHRPSSLVHHLFPIQSRRPYTIRHSVFLGSTQCREEMKDWTWLVTMRWEVMKGKEEGWRDETVIGDRACGEGVNGDASTGGRVVTWVRAQGVGVMKDWVESDQERREGKEVGGEEAC